MDGHRSAKKAASKLEAGLYIVATPIGNLGDITKRALEVLEAADIIACEDTRITHRLLDAYGVKASMLAYNDGNGEKVRPQLLQRLEEGASLALVSDAGTPLISDPGYKLVRESAERGIRITTLPGASSVMAALTLSGLPTNRFLFEGFLPVKTQGRKEALAVLKGIPATLVFFERGSRVGATLADMLEVFGDREAAVVREITKSFEEAVRGRLSELTERFTKEEARGEIVIVVGPPLETDASPEELDKTLRTLLKDHSVKDASALAATALGLPKKQVYQRALELKDER